MSTRRTFLGSVAGAVGVTAGCLGDGDDGPTARCSSHSEGPGGHLQQVVPIGGENGISLAVVVSEESTRSEELDVIEVRNRDGDLLASVPLDDNRSMSDLDPSDHDKLRGEGELYAVPLGARPQHGVVTVSITDPDGETLESVDLRFNCYDPDGELP